MKKIAITALMIAAVMFAADAQKKSMKGPKYKNASPSVKYQGVSTVWVSENPGALQGPQYKNYNKNNDVFKNESGVMTVSLNNGVVLNDNNENQQVFVPLNVNKNKGINSKGLKGPKYKNYRSKR